MLVDDDEDIRSTVREILEEKGYEVLTAAHGAEALDQLRMGPSPDIILLDLMMPVMDGFEFCRRWREDPALSTIPVVVLSADATMKENARACRATAGLDKPLTLRDLLGAIGRYARK